MLERNPSDLKLSQIKIPTSLPLQTSKDDSIIILDESENDDDSDNHDIININTR